MSNTLNNVIETVKEKMDKDHVSQSALAEKLGLRQSYISMLLSQKRNPSFDVIIDISKWAGIKSLKILD